MERVAWRRRPIIIIDRKSKYFHFVKPAILSEWKHAWINLLSPILLLAYGTFRHSSCRHPFRRRISIINLAFAAQTHSILNIWLHIIFTFYAVLNVSYWLNISPYQLIAICLPRTCLRDDTQNATGRGHTKPITIIIFSHHPSSSLSFNHSLLCRIFSIPFLPFVIITTPTIAEYLLWPELSYFSSRELVPYSTYDKGYLNIY